MYKVYMHVFPNGKKYIGITAQSLKRRFDCGRGYQINPMKRAIKKYGWENVKHELLLDNLTKEEAYKEEIELIKKYNTTDSRYGYNVSTGGSGSNGCKASNETKEKMRSAHIGKKLSEETKRKIGQNLMKNITGERFGRLVAIEAAHKNNILYWTCKCDCGNIVTVRANNLLQGKVRSCGCYRHELLILRNRGEVYESDNDIGKAQIL